MLFAMGIHTRLNSCRAMAQLTCAPSRFAAIKCAGGSPSAPVHYGPRALSHAVHTQSDTNSPPPPDWVTRHLCMSTRRRSKVRYEVNRKYDGLGWQPIPWTEARDLVHSLNRPQWPRGRYGVIRMESWMLRIRQR